MFSHDELMLGNFDGFTLSVNVKQVSYLSSCKAITLSLSDVVPMELWLLQEIAM